MSLVDGQVKVEVVLSGQMTSLMSNVEGGIADGMWHAVSLYLQEIRYLQQSKTYSKSLPLNRFLHTG